MAEKIIKHRLFTWFEEDNDHPSGEQVLVERIANLGEKVNITSKRDLARGEKLGAFYTDAEAKAIEDGSYNGPDAAILFNARAGQFSGPKQVTDAEGEHGDIDSMSAEQLADHIRENELSVEKTVALIPEDADEDTLNKFLDAENLATENEPRKGVEKAIEARLNAQTKQ